MIPSMLDPAIMSTPLIAGIIDVVGIMSCMSVFIGLLSAAQNCFFFRGEVALRVRSEAY
jgi:hypothetical protein